MLAAAEGWAADMQALPLPAGLGELRGALGEVEVRLTTTRHRGGGCESLTIARITGADGLLRSATLIGQPTPASLGPVLGVDLIGFGGALSLVAVDLAPTDACAWDARAAGLLHALHAAVAGLVVPRRWPGFAHEVFSPQALIAGVRRGDEAPVLAAIAAFVAEVPAVYAESVTDGERIAAALARSAAWRRAELANRREHDALARIFGPAVAGEYLDLLFGG